MGRQPQLVRAVVGAIGCRKGRTGFLQSGLTHHSAKQVLETRLGHSAFPARAWVQPLVGELRLGKVHSMGKKGRTEGRGGDGAGADDEALQAGGGRDPPALSASPPTTCAHTMITGGTTARYKDPRLYKSTHSSSVMGPQMEFPGDSISLQVALVVKKLPANAGDKKGAGSTPGVGKIP